MQAIGAVFGAKSFRNSAIVLEQNGYSQEFPSSCEAREIERYHLHNYCVTLPDGFMLPFRMPRAA